MHRRSSSIRRFFILVSAFDILIACLTILYKEYAKNTLLEPDAWAINHQMAPDYTISKYNSSARSSLLTYNFITSSYFRNPPPPNITRRTCNDFLFIYSRDYTLNAWPLGPCKGFKLPPVSSYPPPR